MLVRNWARSAGDGERCGNGGGRRSRMLQRMLLLNHDSRHDGKGRAEGAEWVSASGRRVLLYEGSAARD
jgi:hypothetical protein